MRFRLVLTVTVLMLIGLLLAGCGERESTAPDSTPQTTATTETTAPEASTPETESTGPATVEETAPAEETDEPEAAPIEDLGPVVARINGHPGYQAEFDEAKSSLISQYNQVYGQFGMSMDSLMVGAEGRVFELGLEAEAIDRLLSTVLIEAEAESRGIAPADAEIDEKFEERYQQILAEQGWTEDELADYLAANMGMTLKTFREDGRKATAWQATLDAVTADVAGVIEVTDEQMAEHFAENLDAYGTEEQVKTSHILVETAELAESLLVEIEGGADFAELAKEHSTDPGSAVNGGDLPWFGRGMMVAEFEAAAFALEIGEISGVVESQFGFHIIKKEDYKEAYQPELADVADEVRAAVEDELRSERMQAWFTELFDAAEKEILLPELAAFALRTQDIDQAILEMERVRDESLSDDPYIDYIVGSLYETKLTEVEASLEVLQAAEELSEEDQAKISSLEAEIEDLTTKALAEYEKALASFSEDTTIQAKIDALRPQPEEEPTESP